MPKLLLKFNAAVIKEITIDKDVLTVGRKPENDVVIDNPAVSSRHCKIVHSGDAYFVEDMESTNGTFLNEKRIMKAGLKHNDVVGVATSHALVFVEDAPAPAAPPPPEPEPAAEKTVVLSPKRKEDVVKAAQASAAVGKGEKVAGLRVLQGVVDQPEYELKGISTYIGKSDRVQIPIKGTGLFGSAPEVAASIHRKPDGYYLVAVKDGYPVVNGSAVSGQVLLKEGDIIECGSTTMQFYMREPA